jgi:hypothetical protein
MFPPNTHILFLTTFRSRRLPHYHAESQLSFANPFQKSAFAIYGAIGSTGARVESTYAEPRSSPDDSIGDSF